MSYLVCMLPKAGLMHESCRPIHDDGRIDFTWNQTS